MDQPRRDPGGGPTHPARADPRHRVAKRSSQRRHPARTCRDPARSRRPDQRPRDAGGEGRDRRRRLLRAGASLRQRPLPRRGPGAAAGRRATPRRRAGSRSARRGGRRASDAPRPRDGCRREHAVLCRAPRVDGRRGAPPGRRRPDQRDRTVPPGPGERGPAALMTFEGGEPERRVDAPPTPLAAGVPSGRGPSTTDRVINLAIGAGVLVLVVAIAVVAGLASGVIRRPGTAPAGLPTPIRDSVVLVPIAGFPAEQAVVIRDRLSADYGLPISVGTAMSGDASTVDATTGQLVGERVVQQLGLLHPEWKSRVLVIGLTVNDLRIDAR